MKSLATALAAVAALLPGLSIASAKACSNQKGSPQSIWPRRRPTLLATATAFNASTADLEKRMSFFADEAIRLGPGQGALIGKAAIKARAAELKALPGFTVESETKTAEAAAQGTSDRRWVPARRASSPEGQGRDGPGYSP